MVSCPSHPAQRGKKLKSEKVWSLSWSSVKTSNSFNCHIRALGRRYCWVVHQASELAAARKEKLSSPIGTQSKHAQLEENLIYYRLIWPHSVTHSLCGKRSSWVIYVHFLLLSLPKSAVGNGCLRTQVHSIRQQSFIKCFHSCVYVLCTT